MLSWAAKGLILQCGTLPTTASALVSVCSSSSTLVKRGTAAGKYQKLLGLLAAGESACVVAQPSLRTLCTSSGTQSSSNRGLLQALTCSATAAQTSTGVAAGGLVGLLRRQPPQPAGWRAAVAEHLQRLKSTMAAPAAAAAATQAAAPALVGSEALAAGMSPAARRQVMWWLGGTAAWVYTMVVLGGITRLTRSGLSMTDWKFTGERPPVTEADWEAEFDKYKASPEFRHVHSRMTLPEFKFIFWMEYAHRMWGRLLGLAFILPGAYFAARGYINGALARRLGLLLFMGGTQGLVGWWMVRSGLQEPEHEWQLPRVSPYRLAAHLVSAFAIYATLAWTAMDLAAPTPLVRALGQQGSSAAARVRGVMLPYAALVALTATSGAFVAGMDAGHAYNEWPLMDGQVVPHEYWDLWDKGFGVRNFFENTAAVQFDHRLLATTTLAATLVLWPWVRKSSDLPQRARLSMDLVAAVTAFQFTLGVWTLLEYVPVHLGSAHQANALNLFTAVLFALHALRPGHYSPAAAAAARWVAPVAVTSIAGIAYSVVSMQ